MTTTLATMMDVPLTIDLILDRAERWMGARQVVSRRPDRGVTRTTYAGVVAQARQLARALVAAGVKPGDRVATLMWNHAEHLACYFGIPLSGAVIHTLNLRLHPDEIAFIANDAGDTILFVDDVLMPLAEKVVASGAKFTKIVQVGGAGDEFAAFVAGGTADVKLPVLDEKQALGTCYTSGTTGKPKGVVYSHRSTMLHTLVMVGPDALSLSRGDTIMPVVPMFHVNAWGLPYGAAMVGAQLILCGPHLDPASLLDLMATEKVTIAAGVPTIWLGIREAMDAHPGKWVLQPGLRMVVGGSAAPEQLIRDFDRLGMSLCHAWGMTETSPIGLVSRIPPELADASDDVKYRLRAKQGLPPPLVDIALRGEDGTEVAHDDRASGEVMVRGPWITGSYWGGHTPERWTADGWFRTGDVARMDPHGFVQLTDRVADLIKSGGEWIASVEIENALMGHPAVREAAVVGAPHPKWSERPIAVIVLKPGASVDGEALRTYVGERFPKFWIPDAVVFVDTIPRTSAGKFKKTELRDTYRAQFTK